ncbi:T9SS type A sorting domain-containing protein [Chryseobacterium sp. ERMR1:04]|uniref:T9SS type A sorting domain-containing protein n=1 Tax=Chryseobacterium sp. ERMR1:04 TaxID=1705393 RepID=UPI0006CDB466|nr:T9SS type A sorting domain-containing protein [Chryseobacterium sp. ERMR1:04]KPH13706.1 hypothetical protein AMQ68_09180 [Chryseobacterium sp. ERMR1:04]
MNKILLTLCLSLSSMAYSQTLTFTDAKFKALILSSSPTNDIAKDSNGNAIAIDTNGDGEIQASEAQQVKILNLEQDPTQKYIDPNGNTFDPDNINTAYYNNHLPDGITDVLLFSNVEELYFWDTKTANINFVNSTKIKKVQGRPFYYDFSQSGFYTLAPINLSFDNCSGIGNINDIIAYQSISSTLSNPSIENALVIKNCSQINSNAVINLSGIQELSIENSNIQTLTFNTCNFLKKISVSNLNTLTKISILGIPEFTNQIIDLIEANNCTNLQEINIDPDHYYGTEVYVDSINVNGCTNLKKIIGLNTSSINFSNAGLINLEELDCSFYNKNFYVANSGIYFGSLTSLNLAGLPKLKILTAFNQPIAHNVNFGIANQLENIDITNSCGYMNTVDVSNMAHLHTLKTDRIHTLGTAGNNDLQKIITKNCALLANLFITGNYDLKELNLENCPSIQSLNIEGIGYYSSLYNLNNLNVKQCTGLKDLIIHDTKITSLDLSQCPALESLSIGDNSLLSILNSSNNGQLKNFTTINCPLISHLDLSNSIKLENFTLNNMTGLVYANIKNNSIENTSFTNYNSNLTMCVDPAQLINLQNLYSGIGFTTNCGNTLRSNNLEINNPEIILSPNPVKDLVQIKSSDNIKNIKIFDAQGKILLSKDYNKKLIQIDLSTYIQRIYTFVIKTDKIEKSKKIIKE